MTTTKIKTQKELAGIISSKKKEGLLIGFTNGCFDVLHVGHIRYLEQAKRECDILVIGVNSDDSVKKLKGNARPVNPEGARLEVLASLEQVDLLTLFGEETPAELIGSLTPDILFKGGDWDEDSVAGGKHVREHGGKVRIIPYVEGYSTTDIIKKMKGA